MAWQASGAGKRPVTDDSTHDDASFPGLKPKAPDARIEYEELQQNELLALQAIYGDDFVMQAATHGAWKVRHRVAPPCPDTQTVFFHRQSQNKREERRGMKKS